MSEALSVTTTEARPTPSLDPIGCHWLGRIGFAAALELQEDILRNHERHGDTLLLLEHDPVYTTGRAGRDENLPSFGASSAEVPVHRIGRGGDATYHGPGQLVGYALVDLRARGGDVHAFLRALEAGVIDTLADVGVTAERSAGKTGAWVSGRKIASIGIGVRRGITWHGFAINVSVDLSRFDAIVPCGLAGVRMTSVEKETGLAPAIADVARLAAERVPAALGSIDVKGGG